MKLSDFKEQISDDFQSTFTIVDDNTLANMMTERDFPALTKIIHKYLRGAKIEFIKTDELRDKYDIYLVRVVN